MESKPIFILISGKRYAGKDTVAEIFRRQLAAQGRDVALTSFAEAVKREAARLYDLDVDKLLAPHDDAEARAYKEEHRHQLICVGMDGRVRDPGQWTRKVWASHSSHQVVIVSDWRFPDEPSLLEQLGAMVVRVRVHANDSTRNARGWTYNPAVDKSPSETALDNTISVPSMWSGVVFVFNNEHAQWAVLDEQVIQILKRQLK